MTDHPYNPLDRDSLAASVAEAAGRQPYFSLSEVESVTGAGVYLIYYTGPFSAYRLLSEAPGKEPIYTGKAVPSGSRKGGLDLTAASSSDALRARLRTHARSINAAENLEVADFLCQALPVDEIFIALGERGLIQRFRPVWNAIIDGFGNHDPGRGRHKGVRSRWDTLHPGRPWVSNFPPRQETAAAISRDAEEYLRQRLT